MAVGVHKVVECLVEFRNQWFQPGIVFVLGLVLHHVCQCALDGSVGIETFLFGVSLYLLVIHFKRTVPTSVCNDEFAVFHVQFANFLAVCRCVAHIRGLCALGGCHAAACLLGK